jgi:hypothetical protein
VFLKVLVPRAAPPAAPWNANGIGRRTPAAPEDHARRHGYRAARLETGVRAPEALGLCESAGRRRTDNCGIDAGNPPGVCFEDRPARGRAGQISRELHRAPGKSSRRPVS